MSTSPKPKRLRPVKVYIAGDKNHNFPFIAAIGHLVVDWANCESVFRAMLDTLLRDDSKSKRATVVWFSLRNTQARLEILWNLCRQEIKNKRLLKDIEKALERFRKLSDTRHFYCHGMFEYSPEGYLVRAIGAHVSRDGKPLRSESKRLDRARLNEIQDTSRNLVRLNHEVWRLVKRLGKHLGVPTAVSIPRIPKPKKKT